MLRILSPFEKTKAVRIFLIENLNIVILLEYFEYSSSNEPGCCIKSKILVSLFESELMMVY